MTKKIIVSANVENEEEIYREVVEFVACPIDKGKTQEIVDELDKQFGSRLKLEGVEADYVRGKVYGDKVRKESITRLNSYINIFKQIGYKFE